jgi:hypothetical protein
VVALNKGAMERKKTKVFKKLSKNTCEIEKEVVLLHPLRETRRHCESNEVKKQEEHVPRHIELTAVLREISRQNQRVQN